MDLLARGGRGPAELDPVGEQLTVPTLGGATTTVAPLRPSEPAVDAAGPGPVSPWAASAWLAAGALLLAAAELSVLEGAYLPFLSPAVGALACLGVPTFLLYHRLGPGRWFNGAERTAAAVCAAVLLVILVSLLDNTLLPLVGVDRPLDTAPVLISADVVDVILAALTYRYLPARLGLRDLRPTGWRGQVLLCAAVLTVPLAAMGAVRVNNGAGAGLTMFDLALITVVAALLVAWRDLIDSVVTSVGLYAVSLALLFMTSLRGWYTTGHDTQHEMLSFLTTAGHGRWTTTIHDGYNGCLSITILPTVLLHWTRVADPYVYKVFFQLLFAVCPVVLYYLGRRITSDAMSLCSTFFFVGFVAYLQDMPMINRQEMGFLFFSTALLMLFMTEWPRRRRWVAFCVLATGMVLSHYSTAYFACAALVGALLLDVALRRALPRIVPRWKRLVDTRPPFELLGWRPLLFLLAVTALWNGPINQSGDGLVTQVSNAITHAVNGSSSTRAAETSYSLAGPGRGTTQDQAVQALLAAEQKVRVKHPGFFLPAPAPSTQLTPLAPTTVLPATPVGKALLGSQHNLETFNRWWRTAAAWGLQLLLALGLAVVVFRRRYVTTFSTDVVLLGIAMVVLLGVQIVLPGISLAYGVARSFMQALMVLGPFMAIGAATLGNALFPRWRTGLACGLAGVIFISTSGFVPQLLGGYAPQLHLNNSGDYYDRYLVQPQEVTGLDWLKGSVIARSPFYPAIQTDTNVFNEAKSLEGIRAFNDIYPSDILKNAYVVLGPNSVVDGKVLEVFDGYELWFKYPSGILSANKSLIYSNGGIQIYR